ncbi:membrane protein YczE [Allosalinactinospora lopnorensis]|uniref:membrane protein YczE n=1 Tax=Allosalinactinospora lopnorensis TaxID=1352348 RepID=UPI000623F699|nr:membrane protein [Allosalinactinospora lopnorensis]
MARFLRPLPDGSIRQFALVHRLFVTPVLPRSRRLRRLLQLYAGLHLYGVSGALLITADLGAMPWDVLHQGLSLRTGLSIGTWSVIVGAAVMLLWIPLRQRPGLGTVSNVVVVGLSVDYTLWWLPGMEGPVARSASLVTGIVLTALATSCYIGVRLGSGPRDGLMTGLAAKGFSIRAARTGIEVAVVATGFLLGGTVGVGTLLFAAAIGPLTQAFLPVMAIPESSTPA